MGKRSVSRRQFLAEAGAGGAALALVPAAAPTSAAAATTAATPAAAAQAQGVVTPQLLTQLAAYANFPLPPERAAEIAPLLAGPLAAFRNARPVGYGNMQPAAVFRVPEES